MAKDSTRDVKTVSARKELIPPSSWPPGQWELAVVSFHGRLATAEGKTDSPAGS